MELSLHLVKIYKQDEKLRRGYENMNWKDLKQKEIIRLYAGDIPRTHPQYYTHVGLSLEQDNMNHIRHDVSRPFPIEDGVVSVFQSEDVYEHMETKFIVPMLNEVYRVLKPSGHLRLSLPDYHCDILRNRTLKNEKGDLLFDPGGGGRYMDNKVVDGGHLWFPTYKQVNHFIEQSYFEKYVFFHYYEDKDDNLGTTIPINYFFGHISRTPDHDNRVKDPYRPMSIVVDLYK
jgi:SAM-dependent methyltransferase